MAVLVGPTKPPPLLTQLTEEPPGSTFTLTATTELAPQPKVGVVAELAVTVGLVIFCVTFTVPADAALGQPFELFVTTKLYTPGALTVGD